MPERYLLADLEGMYLTLRMMVRNDTLTINSNTFLFYMSKLQCLVYSINYLREKHTELDSKLKFLPPPLQLETNLCTPQVSL